MKKLLLGVATIATLTLSAQTTNNTEPTARENAKIATQEGNYMVGVNTTSLGFTNIKDATNVNAGLTVGTFAKDNLAVIVSGGYQSQHVNGVNTNDWFYGAGVKYYLGSLIPIQVDWKGSTGNSNNPSKSYVGFQGGYAWFPFSNFSIEPAIRYDLSTKTEHEDVFSGALGFNLFF